MNKNVLNNKVIELMHHIDQIELEELKLHCLKVKQIEQLIKEYLREMPQDTEMWLKLALVEYRFPLADHIRAIECVKNILAYDPNNTYAAVLLKVFSDWDIVNEECFDILCAIKTEDNEFKAMIEFAKALYYDAKDNVQKYSKHYKNAKFFWRLHVKEFLSKYSCDDHGPTLDERVQANLKIICKGYQKVSYNSLSVEQFLNEEVRIKISR